MVAQNNPKLRCIGQEPVTEYPSGFFDGASTNMIGGVGVFLLFSHDYSFSINMGCGKSTNTISELLALWVLLSIAKGFGIPSLHV